MQHRSGDGFVCAAAKSCAPLPVVAVGAALAPPARISPQGGHFVPTLLANFSNLMSGAMEAALKPMKERLEATILPMQRTLQGLDAECVAFGAEENYDIMISGTAADAARMRTGLGA